jgi:Na+-transporting NADH:ubiquinone oxidoreductase subunit NqrD
MNGGVQQIFFNKRNPLFSLMPVCLLIFSSSRLSFAIVITLALIWVYGLTALLLFAAKPLLPQEGEIIVVVFLSSFVTSIFLFVLWFISPLLTLEILYLTLLVPVCFVGIFPCEKLGSLNVIESTSQTLSDAIVLGSIIIALSLIREPLGFMTLSLPGGAQGFVELFNLSDETTFFPIRILSGISGALLLLGYIAAIFHTIIKRYGGAE